MVACRGGIHQVSSAPQKKDEEEVDGGSGRICSLVADTSGHTQAQNPKFIQLQIEPIETA